MSKKLFDRLEPRRLLAIIYVDWNAPIGTNNGSSWGNAFQDLHEALTAANPGDSIRIADGTYKPTTGTDRTIAFQLKSGVSLYGGYAGHGAINPDARDFVNTPTILSGEIGTSSTDDNSYNVLKGNELAELVTIDGFTVTQTWGGNYLALGAIRVNDVNLLVRNLAVVSNDSGIWFETNGQYELQMFDSHFSLNNYGVSTSSYYQFDHQALVENCTFTQNGIGFSASIGDFSYHAEGIQITLRSSHFDGNESGASITAGGAVFDCTFNNNTGSGLFIYTGLVMNSELNDNGANGMYAEQFVTVINSEFCRNGGNAASWFRSLGFRNCKFIGNALTALEQYPSDDASGAGVYECLFVGNPVGVNISNGSVTRSVFIGNGTAVDMRENYLSASLPVTNNTFYGNTANAGSVVSCSWYVHTSLVFQRNIAWNNGGSPDIDLHPGKGDVFDQYVEDSIIDEGYPDGTNISTVDPQFIEEPNPGADNVWGTQDDDCGDLHLQIDSPAIGWGYGAYADVEHLVTLVGNEYVLSATDGDDTITVNRNDAYGPYVSLISFQLNGRYESVVADYSHGIRVNAKSGNDRVTATSGSRLVTFDGGSGNDTLTGGNDGDVLIGGEGNDELRGKRGNDSIFGGGGNDAIFAGDGNDLVDGGNDFDTISVTNDGTTNSATILPSGGDDQVVVGLNGVSLATAIFQGTQRINTLTIGAKGRAQIASDGNSVLTLSVLSINSVSQLDITNNSIIFDHEPFPNPIFSVKSLITSGYNGGSWNGHGIISSTAALNTRTAIGYAASTAMFANFPATFHGQPIDETAIVISHTLKGDANLDRVVNFNDLLRVAQHYGSNFAVWYEGDFNYDGLVNFNDLLPMAQNYNVGWVLVDSMKDRRPAVARINL